MGINTFVRLTEPVRGMVRRENIDAYILPVLSSIGIRIGMVTEAEGVFNESDFQEKDLEVFCAEDIAVVWEGGFYSCLIDNLDGESIAFTLDDFISPDDINLLHFLCHAYCGYFGNGCIIDETRICIELASNEERYTDVRAIPLPLLKEIIVSAIARKYPLYANFSPEMCIKKFYDDFVFPLLSEEYLTGAFEE
ncbi:MAG: hypothetical protein PHN60_02810 [Candidatus Gracilibacteria bacterium]|nr:hypothetical protein [Candidatus Gracilibacteria bacterium]